MAGRSDDDVVTPLSKDVFFVMVNNRRVSVQRQTPFIVPQTLIDGAALPSWVSRIAAAPVLLADCTGDIRHRRQDAKEREKLKLRIACTISNHQECRQIARRLEMTRLRRQEKLKAMETLNDGPHPIDVAVLTKELQDIAADLAANAAERTALSQQLRQLRRELHSQCTATPTPPFAAKKAAPMASSSSPSSALDGSIVLLLPSPQTGLVQLTENHIYRTVVFHGDTLRPYPPQYPGEDITGRAPPHEEPLYRWATAEILGFALYANDSWREQSAEERRCPANYFALPACERAMYQERAIRQFRLEDDSSSV